MHKTIQKTKQNKNRQNPRKNGKCKAIQTKSHKGAYTFTVTKREKGKKYIYLHIKKKRKRATTSITKSTSDDKL